MKVYEVSCMFKVRGETRKINYQFRVVPVIGDLVYLPGWGNYEVVSRAMNADALDGSIALLGLKELDND